MKLFTTLVAILVSGLCVGRVHAQLLTNTYNYSLTLAIPDNDLSGVSDTRTVSSPIMFLTDIRVTLDISGGFNGDYYAYLVHDSGFAVLLNRPGRAAGNPFGYADSGLNVTFDDAAPGGDIHTYQLTLNPGGGALTGTWQPDGRNVVPSVSLDTTPRGPLLSSFDGQNPNGEWTLFLADASPVGNGTFNGWSIELVGTVPEPGTWALLLLGASGMFLLRRRKK